MRPVRSSEFLTTSEAADLVKVSPATLKRWARAGIIPSERTSGGHRRYRREDLEGYLGPGKGHDLVARYVDTLLETRSPVPLQADLLRERTARGSWWAVCEWLLPVIFELHQRRERGLVTGVQREAAFDLLRDALGRFRDLASPSPEAPVVMVASVPGDHILVLPAALELCALESQWAPRWAGHPTPRDLAAELRQRPVEALILCASAGLDAAALARLAPPLVAAVRAAGIPLGLAGSAAWPRSLAGAYPFLVFREAREWLSTLRPGKVPSRAEEPPPPGPAAPTWDPFLSVGEPMIDLQHQRLFAEFHRLRAALDQGEPTERLHELLAFLTSYADAHFRCEEKLMSANGFPELKAHRRDHDAFRAFVGAVTREIEAGGPPLELYGRTAGYVRDWLLTHVNTFDRRFGEYLRRPES